MNPTLVAQYQTVFLSDITFNEKQRLYTSILKQSGMKYNGKSKMRLGTTGQLIRCEIYSGFVYLSILKQLAKDKLRSRDRGPVNELTRQTTVGRKNQGGTRNGEMENWCLYGVGQSNMFQSINQESADRFLLYHCTKCQLPAIGNQETKLYYCLVCKTGKHVGRLPSTYISNLTPQELAVMGFGHKTVAEVDHSELRMDEDKIFAQNNN